MVKKANKIYSPEPYHATPEEWKALSWCFNNGITMATIWVEYPGDWRVEINLNGKKTVSPISLSRNEVVEKMFGYYTYYYKKYDK
jgi:hypothetical protein